MIKSVIQSINQCTDIPGTSDYTRERSSEEGKEGTKEEKRRTERRYERNKDKNYGDWMVDWRTKTGERVNEWLSCDNGTHGLQSHSHNGLVFNKVIKCTATSTRRDQKYYSLQLYLCTECSYALNDFCHKLGSWIEFRLTRKLSGAESLVFPRTVRTSCLSVKCWVSTCSKPFDLQPGVSGIARILTGRNWFKIALPVLWSGGPRKDS